MSACAVAAGGLCPRVACGGTVVSPGCRAVCRELSEAFCWRFHGATLAEFSPVAPWHSRHQQGQLLFHLQRGSCPASQGLADHSKALLSPTPSHGMPSITVAFSPDECQQHPFSRGRAPGPGLPETPAAAFSDCLLCWKQWPIRLSLCHVEITH